MPHDCAIVLYARRPRHGLVKTRLTPLVGVDGALRLHRAMLLDSIVLLRRASGRTVRPLVAFADAADPSDDAPDHELSRALVGLTLLPQRGADLGERLRETFRSLFEQGLERVVIFGSDSPTLPADRLRQALTRLETGTDVVIGPADDGGYYLIGARRLPAGLFEGIPWGGAGVLRATVAALNRGGSSWSLLDPWYDVDRPADLARLWSELQASPDPAARHTARACAALLRAGDGTT